MSSSTTPELVIGRSPERIVANPVSCDVHREETHETREDSRNKRPTETDHEPIEAKDRGERVAGTTRVGENGRERDDEHGNRREYWKVRVVPEDNSGIAYVAFVDARSGDVDSFEQTDAITQFLAGETPVETPTETEPSETTAETPTVIVQRVAENGTVIETMTVYDDESVEIRTPTNSTAGTENTTARALGS